MKTKSHSSNRSAPQPVALPVDKLTPRPENREVPDDSDGYLVEVPPELCD